MTAVTRGIDPPLARASTRASATADLLFVALVVVLSSAPYVTRLGFYSDDWAILGRFVNSPDQSLAGLFTTQWYGTRLSMRPTQMAYHALLFKAFGLNPLGYHVTNLAVLTSAAMFLYLVLRELIMHRAIALAIALVYGVLASYSTDRFWFVAFTYPLSVALFLAGAYALLRAGSSRLFAVWMFIGVGALAAAMLGMEVVIPLALVLPVALWMRAAQRREHGVSSGVPMARLLVLLGAPMAVTAVVVVFKATRSVVSAAPDLYWVALVAIGSLGVNFGTYGVALPHTAAWGISHARPANLALAAILGLFVFVYLLKVGRASHSRSVWLVTGSAGAVVFVLGTAIFTTTRIVEFWSAGVANRAWIAASIGSAMVLVAVAGGVTSWFRSAALRANVFAGLVATLCFSNVAINTTIGEQWAAAWPRQVEVLNGIRRTLPAIEPHTTVVLHAVCAYVGPAITFESSWDLAGALRIIYRDPTLRADVTSGNLSVRDDGLATRLYGRLHFYPYGSDLVLFDHARQAVVPLTNANVARQHLSERTRCPDGVAGRGTVVLPFDALYAKGFRPWK